MDHVPQNFEAPFRVIAETAFDAIITIDQHSTIIFVCRSRADLRLQRALRRYAHTGQRHIAWGGIELPGLHKNGSVIPLEISFGEFVVDGQRLFTGIARDITQRTREQRLKSAYTAAARVLAEHPSSASVLRETLSAICRALEWKLGILWNAEAAADELRVAASPLPSRNSPLGSR